MNPRDFDLVIVGNGAVASALALVFSERYPDMKIAMIGPRQRPGCASLAAGAMLNAFAELEEGALDYPLARRKFEISRSATGQWETHLELLNSRSGVERPVRILPGTHVVSNACADSLDDRNFRAIIRYLAEHGEPFSEIDPASIPGIRPSAAARPLRAIHIPGEGRLPARELLQAYDAALASASNVVLMDAEAAAISAGARQNQVALRDGTAITGRHIILAAGSRTQDFVTQLGLEARIPRLVHGIGVSLILKTGAEGPRSVFRTPNRGLACGVYSVPYENGYCYVGATNHVCPWEIPAPRVHALHFLLTSALEQINGEFFKSEVHKTLVGYRPTTLDAFPLIGRTSCEGIWLVSGTKRDGLHQSPAIAREVVRCFETGEQPFDGAFKPERRLILETPRELAITRAVEHQVSAGYQHGFRLPHSNWEPLIVEAVRKKVVDAYEKSGLDSSDYGIPPELLDMYRHGHAARNIEYLKAPAR